MMEEVQTSETLVNLHQFMRRYNPEDSHLPCSVCFDHCIRVSVYTRYFAQTGQILAGYLHRVSALELAERRHSLFPAKKRELGGLNRMYFVYEINIL
jgi:hypothetical protein